MNALVFVMLTAFAVAPAHAEPVPKKKQKSWIERLFQSQKPKAIPKSKKKIVVKPTPPPQPKSKTRVVDTEWMARYLEQEAAWDYQIPDDDLIKFQDGKYHVPPVVFKHYEDMLATPRRSPTPKPIPSPTTRHEL